MKKSSRMDIEFKSEGTNTVQFEELEVGDVFRVVDKDQLYMVVQMPPGNLVLKQGVYLDNGERRVFNKHTACVQVKVVCLWVDMQP